MQIGYTVVCIGEKWAVRFGSITLSEHPTQHEAEEAAERFAKADKRRLTVHGTD